ncbi:putative glutathione transferase [Medicago truncatula]|uniref:glutathione transferase n=1 Tax=Medicago truncatula TaxID=3880 RepID=A0A072UB35_MEDTR|nr:probable glutathione S-transferase [Medicago truncatula]AUW37475.1 putative tau class glutathione transferase GSTU14 [Medicago truncatula]KEH23050.1 glutathione S-transferase, amino-terminal domain protein [Medicago truncatula]RHN46278.1 putative glutathione transferase [Medicago truncatula]
MASNKEEVKVFGLVESPFVTRVEIALKLKGVEYKYEQEKVGNLSETLKKYNPVYKKVPVFIHNDKPISESLVILEYIDETWKQNPILPSDPSKRALARFWSNFIDDKCSNGARKVCFPLDEKEREKSIEETKEALHFLENELKDKFFGGEDIGFVDIAAVVISFWFSPIQEAFGLKLFTIEEFPKLYNWSQEFNNHPIVKEKLPPRETLLAFYKGRYEEHFGSK